MFFKSNQLTSTATKNNYGSDILFELLCILLIILLIIKKCREPP